MSEEKKKGLFARLREGLSKTRGNMTEKVDDMVRENRKIDEDFYEELEDILLMADCGLKATTVMIDDLRARVKAGKVKDAAEAREMLKQIMVEQMDIPRPPLKWPMVMLMVGVNGVGKTTTIGKLALRFQSIGRKVMLCAGDTFRAAAAEQLTVWAERARVPIIKHAEGADPAAVVFAAGGPADYRYGGPAAQQEEPYGRAEQDAPGHRPGVPGSGYPLHPGAGRDHRPERAHPGPGLQGSRRDRRNHPDEAGRHRQGRHRAGDPAGAGGAGVVYRRRRGN